MASKIPSTVVKRPPKAEGPTSQSSSGMRKLQVSDFNTSRVKSSFVAIVTSKRTPFSSMPPPDFTSLVLQPQTSHTVAIITTSLKCGILLDELISHEEIISTSKYKRNFAYHQPINRFINQKHLPHLLFYGPSDTGKTSAILACAKQLYTPAQFKSMELELNASDDRCIGIVGGQILNFASTRTIFSGTFKLIILDEADAMTNDAQDALRRIIERYTMLGCLQLLNRLSPKQRDRTVQILCRENSGSIEKTLSKNPKRRLSKIIPAVQSRCTSFRFAPLSQEKIFPRLDKIIKEEKVNVTENGKKALITLWKGDMSKALNVYKVPVLRSAFSVYICVGHPLRRDIEKILETRPKVLHRLTMGLALEDIFTELHLFVMIEISMSVMNNLIIKIAAIEERLAKGCTEAS
uniref:AAA+ ATPase domain-containing protein n=1 Tax=Glossina palpalis gambiensis TaxID=67801 RepID=A0A1B0ANG9_9MUSC